MCHILMDFPTLYGTRLLSPFDWHWFATDLMPIVDVYLIVIMVAGLLFGSARRPRRADAMRRSCSSLMAANYGVRAVARHQAIGLAPRVFGPTWPQRCDGGAHDDRALLVDVAAQGDADDADVTGSRCLVEVAAMPSFFSPFRWRLIAQMSNAYELHDVDVLDARLRRPPEAGEAPWRVTVRYPNQWTPAVHTAAAATLPQVFSGFSRFPAARWFTDPPNRRDDRALDRHAICDGPDDRSARGRSNLFTVTVRLDRDGRLIDEKFGG